MGVEAGRTWAHGRVGSPRVVRSGSPQACVIACMPVESPPDRAVCRMPACMHLTQIGRQGTENTCGLTADPCNAWGKTPPRTLFSLPALRHGAATISPRYSEGPFNPVSL